MARCDVCGNDYDKAFTVKGPGGSGRSTASSARSTSWRRSAGIAAAWSSAFRSRGGGGEQRGHAKAKRIQVTLEYADDKYVVVTVEDDGVGFEPEVLEADLQRESFGLIEHEGADRAIGRRVLRLQFAGRGTRRLCVSRASAAQDRP